MNEFSDDTLKELAVTAGKSIDFVQGITDYISDTIGDPIRGLFQTWVTDPVNAQRKIKLIELVARVKEKMMENNVTDVRSVAPKVILPLIEAATLEDNQDIDEMWANLLVSALNPSDAEIKRKYVSVLTDFSNDDVALLKYLSRKDTSYKKTKTFDGVESVEILAIPEGFERPYPKAELLSIETVSETTIRNFLNYDLVKPDFKWIHIDGNPSRNSFPVHRDVFEIKVTSFGRDFINRVIKKIK